MPLQIPEFPPPLKWRLPLQYLTKGASPPSRQWESRPSLFPLQSARIQAKDAYPLQSVAIQVHGLHGFLSLSSRGVHILPWCRLLLQFYAFFTSSHLITESIFMSFFACIPIITSLNSGEIPFPGLFIIMSSDDMVLPAFMLRAAIRLLLAKFLASSSFFAGFFIPSPIALSTFLIASTIFFNSRGSRDALWSGPSIFLSSVKCFSIILAPIATAAIGSSMPIV